MASLAAQGLPSEVIDQLLKTSGSSAEFQRRVREALAEQRAEAAPVAPPSPDVREGLFDTLEYIHEQAQYGIKSGDVGAFMAIAEALESIEPRLARKPG